MVKRKSRESLNTEASQKRGTAERCSDCVRAAWLALGMRDYPAIGSELA